MASLSADIELLQRVPLLADFSIEQLKLIAFSADDRTLEAGDVLFRAGDKADGGYVVSTGQVRLVRDASGDEAVLATLGPAAFLGEIAVLVETTRPTTAVAASRTRLIQIRRALFRRVLREYPDLARSMANRIAGRIQDATGELDRVRCILDAIDTP